MRSLPIQLDDLAKRLVAGMLVAVLAVCGVPAEALAEAVDEARVSIDEPALLEDEQEPAADGGATEEQQVEIVTPDEEGSNDPADEPLAVISEGTEEAELPEEEQGSDEEAAGADEASSEAEPIVEEASQDEATDQEEPSEDEPMRAVAEPSGPNLTAARKKYPVADGCVLEAVTADEIVEQLEAAASQASTSSPYIVHVPDGSYAISSITVEPNVLLVSEAGASYTATGSATAMVRLNGSLYGGSFDAKSKTTNVVRFGKFKFSGRNGIVEKITTTHAIADGILTTSLGCDNAQAIDCVAKDNGKSGICALHDSSYKLISGCTSVHNGYSKESGYSGINLSHSDVGRIENCYVAYNRDKGISANSDPIAGCTHPGCAIGTITGCTFVGNMNNGVYLKPKCHVDVFTNNVLRDNDDGLSCVGETPEGTKGVSYAKVVKNNVFENNTTSSICARYPGASINVGDNNRIIGSKKNCVIAQNGATVIISGCNVEIAKAKWAGIRAGKSSSFKGKTKSIIKITGPGVVVRDCSSHCINLDQAKLTISGSGTTISGSKASGIMVNPKSSLTITGSKTTISSNKVRGIHENKGTVTIKGKGTVIKSNGGDGIFASGGKVTITGKKTKIQKNKAHGILAKAKAKVTYKKKNVKLTKNKKGATSASGGAKIKKK